MKATIRLMDGVTFEGISGSGHKLIVDGPPEHGGRNQGARPMELMLMGLGACSAFDVVHILRKARQDVSDCRVELEAERAEDVPKVFTRIHLKYLVSGRNLQERAVKRAVELSAEKYCSASIMLSKTATITHEFETINLD